jgi:hypothetical protein
MARKTAGLERLSRDAAIRVGLCAALILVVCFALLEGTDWKQLRSPEAEPFYTALPGVDLSGVPPAKLAALLKRLNVERCTCDCGRSVASCRNNHRSCTNSLAAAREAVAAAKGE